MSSNFLTRVQYKLRYYRRQLPFYAAIIRILLDGLSKLGIVINPYFMFRDYLDETNKPSVDGFGEYEIGPLSVQDMTAIAALPDRIVSNPEVLSHRIESGQLCRGAKHDGRIIAFAWADLRNCQIEDHTLFALRADEAYLFDIYTVPDHRGRGIATFVRDQFARELCMAGRRIIYSRFALFNEPSERVERRPNFEKLEFAVYVRLWQFVKFHVRLRDYR